MAEISARLVELEEAQKTQALPNEALRRLEDMEKSLQSTHREGSKLPSDSCLPEQVGTQLDELSGLVSKALKVAENSRIPRIFGPDNCGALGRTITSGKEPRWK